MLDHLRRLRYLRSFAPPLKVVVRVRNGWSPGLLTGVQGQRAQPPGSRSRTSTMDTPSITRASHPAIVRLPGGPLWALLVAAVHFWTTRALGQRRDTSTSSVVSGGGDSSGEEARSQPLEMDTKALGRQAVQKRGLHPVTRVSRIQDSRSAGGVDERSRTVPRPRFCATFETLAHLGFRARCSPIAPDRPIRVRPSERRRQRNWLPCPREPRFLSTPVPRVR